VQIPIRTRPAGDLDQQPIHCGKLPLPDRLYGRERELAELTTVLERVCSGKSELVLVSGSAGVGKSALVRQLRAKVAARGGLFVEGKFDLRKANAPYSSLVEAFEMLVAEILAKPVVERERWRSRIVEALGPNGRALTDIAPGLVAMIGEQPPLAPLDPLESLIRLQTALHAFLGAFAGAGHPLAFFLDDLQWADPATLVILRALACEPPGSGLLLLGALCPEEVEAHHPVARLEAELRSGGAPFTRIELKPLERRDLEQLLDDTLRPRESVAQLTALVHEKTAGNPFFVWQLVRALRKEGLVYFDLDRGTWTWNPRSLEQVDITDDVGDLLSKAIDGLSETAREMLPIAACAGKAVDVRMLAAVLSLSPEAVREALEEAVSEDLLVPDVRTGTYHFAHDRVQRAAYARLDERRRQDIHLRIGRHIVQHSTDIDERLFDAADQMNLGAPLLTSDDERVGLAELDSRAGRKARGTAAYAPALAYLLAGIAVLPETSWDDRHDLAFALHRDAAECALVSGEQSLMSRLAHDALDHARFPREKADIHNIAVIGAIVRAAWNEGLSRGETSLRELGFIEDLPRHFEEGISAERRSIERLMRGRSPESLVDEPLITDEDDAAVLRLLASVLHPAWFNHRELFAFLAARAVRFTLEHGHGPASLSVFSDWAACLAARGQHDDAEAFARLALSLVRRFGDRAQEGNAMFMISAFVNPWRHPYSAVISRLRNAVSVAVEGSEIRSAGYALATIVMARFADGSDLSEVLREVDAAMPYLELTHNGAMARFTLAYRQTARALKGLTFERGGFDDDDFSEASYLASVREEDSSRSIYEIRRLVTAYLFGDFVDAAAHADEANRLRVFVAGFFPIIELNLFSSLTFAALCEGASPEHRAELVAKIRENQQTLAAWLPECPTTFRGKHLLVEAELARVEGRHAEAADLYDAAIEEAAHERFLQEEAIARELAARHARGRGRTRIAEFHLREAQRMYAEWGAAEKVRALEEEFPFLRVALRAAAGE
jgi:predicted ATPase